MTPRYAKLADKDKRIGELPGRTSQAKRGDKSRAEPTVHSGGERNTRTLYTRVKTQVESHCGRLSGNQEDKLDWRDVTNTDECAPEWEPRGQVGSTQDATGGFIYTTAHSITKYFSNATESCADMSLLLIALSLVLTDALSSRLTTMMTRCSTVLSKT